jgi:Mce-associated membrane protein
VTDEADRDEPPPPDAWPVEGPEGEDDGRLLNSPRLTRMLLRVAAVIAVVLVAEAAWATVDKVTEDDPPEPAPAAEGAISVPKGRPVLPTELVVQEGVEAAAKAAEKIVNRTFQDYDAEVDEATALMTDDFATEYRQTTDDVREEFIRRRTTVQVRVVGQGVVRANDTELQALVFLNQYVVRAKGDNPKTTYTPYRALLTMVSTESGWLVDDLQTE